MIALQKHKALKLLDQNIDKNDVVILATAVIETALEDSKRDVELVSGTTNKNTIAWIIIDARKFLTDTFGEWAEAREIWCDAANINSEAVRVYASKILKAYPKVRANSPRRDHLPQVEQLPKLKTLHPILEEMKTYAEKHNLSYAKLSSLCGPSSGDRLMRDMILGRHPGKKVVERIIAIIRNENANHDSNS